jgi:hypothetical protein
LIRSKKFRSFLREKPMSLSAARQLAKSFRLCATSKAERKFAFHWCAVTLEWLAALRPYDRKN